ncbi:hypothetical protein DFJ58DRAFT_403745 [Suillus subalutaceus]|uniref:uncharacterized protein n=1 Tax=Suillus subalutaceus TaxID=48586 RepID=UPI001B863351|nr:uncharacterized protein DFJ58DRAFT_403745 [Suillus subalutaceus]KAG1822325.1 hypothetical protein DFJ58DRAFT_403745 [Suillus subalutaceus]
MLLMSYIVKNLVWMLLTAGKAAAEEEKIFRSFAYKYQSISLPKITTTVTCHPPASQQYLKHKPWLQMRARHRSLSLALSDVACLKAVSRRAAAEEWT